MKRKIISIVIVIVTCLSMNLYTFATSVTELEHQKNEAANNKNEAEKELKGVQEEKSETMTEIEGLTTQILESQEELDRLNAKVNQLEESIKQTEAELAEAEQRQKKQQDALEARVVAQYKAKSISYWDILLSPKSPLEFISNLHMFNKIAKYDNELIDSIEKEKQTIQAKQEELESQKAEIKAAKKSAENENVKLKNAKIIKNSKVAQLSEEEKQLQQKIDDYNAAIQNVESQITTMLKQAEQQMNKNNGETGIKFDGSFIWPCNNKIVTSRVKLRWGKWHKGIDIGARYEDVYASASGYAYNATNPGGYGTYVMIVHGDGYITLYGHLERSKISNGQYVSQGQVIATSGNTGVSTGAHLHFEIRKCSSISSMFTSGNNYLNPLDYLPGGYTLQSGA